MYLSKTKMFIRLRERWNSSSENSKPNSYQMISLRICPTTWVRTKLWKLAVDCSIIFQTISFFQTFRKWIEHSIDSKWTQCGRLFITWNTQICAATSYTVSQMMILLKYVQINENKSNLSCRVDANREHNLMSASNLSIVWGASLFSSSVNITNAFETSDLLRRNTLIKILIQRYDDIFIDTDRLI